MRPVRCGECGSGIKACGDAAMGVSLLEADGHRNASPCIGVQARACAERAPVRQRAYDPIRREARPEAWWQGATRGAGQACRLRLLRGPGRGPADALLCPGKPAKISMDECKDERI